MQVEEVQNECDRLISVMRGRRFNYTLSSWCLAAAEFITNCITVITSASIIWTSEEIVNYLTLASAIISLVIAAIHRYINPEGKAIEYNTQLRSCLEVKSELYKFTGKSQRAARYYAYLQEIDTGLFALALPNSIASESSPVKSPKPLFEEESNICLPQTPTKRSKHPSILPIELSNM